MASSYSVCVRNDNYMVRRIQWITVEINGFTIKHGGNRSSDRDMPRLQKEDRISAHSQRMQMHVRTCAERLDHISLKH